MNTSWKPSNTVTDHFGKPIPSTVDFFLPPLKEIGNVLSAWSDFKVGQNLWSLPLKLIVSIAASAAAIFIPLALSNLHILTDKNGGLAAFLCGCLVITLSAIFCFRPRRLSYVGEKGAVIYLSQGHRDDAKPQLFRFADAADMQYTEKEVRHKGMTQIAFKLRFVGIAGQTLFKLSAHDPLVGETFQPRSPYMIAAAIRKAWEQHCEAK